MVYIFSLVCFSQEEGAGHFRSEAKPLDFPLQFLLGKYSTEDPDPSP